MEQERKFIISESQLKSFLEDAIKLSMLEGAGVDNWCGYGLGRAETIRDWYPEPLSLDDIIESEIDFRETAEALIECGEYTEYEE